jgi:hypothetical protein
MPEEQPTNILRRLIQNATNIQLKDIAAIIENEFFKFLTYFAGSVAVIYIILGGYEYLTSGGDSKKIASAKATLLWAIIGLTIIISAQVIVTVWKNLLKGKMSLF